ncbi:hypothetical protein Tco_0528163 [Tanacetum coccineum]
MEIGLSNKVLLFEDLVPIPIEFRGVPKMCDVLFVKIPPLLMLSINILRLLSIPTMIILQVMTILPTVRISIMWMQHLLMLRSFTRVVEIIVPESWKDLMMNILLTIKDDTLREKLLNVESNLLLKSRCSLRDNPAHHLSDIVITSTSTFSNLSSGGGGGGRKHALIILFPEIQPFALTRRDWVDGMSHYSF